MEILYAYNKICVSLGTVIWTFMIIGIAASIITGIVLAIFFVSVHIFGYIAVITILAIYYLIDYYILDELYSQAGKPVRMLDKGINP